jgi:hypothetical protein
MSDDGKIIPLRKSTAIELLEELLDGANRGEFETMIVITEEKDGPNVRWSNMTGQKLAILHGVLQLEIIKEISRANSCSCGEE